MVWICPGEGEQVGQGSWGAKERGQGDLSTNLREYKLTNKIDYIKIFNNRSR